MIFMTRKACLALVAGFLLLLPGVLYGQNGNKQKDLVISGVVLDSASMAPVPYATVTLCAQSPADTLRQVTDNFGQFSILSPQAKSYKLTASFIGKRAIPLQLTAEQVRNIPVRLLMADEDTELGEVTVTAAKPLVTLAIDRIGYSVQDDPMSQTESLTDMLRKVPLVTVDGEGNVQVKGSNNFQIHINGKPSPMTKGNAKDVLRSIPASSVKNIEVITDPGVKYDAEGVNAILNIVTVGRSLEGLSGSVRLRGAYPWAVGFGGNITAKIGKVGVIANYSHWNNSSRPNKADKRSVFNQEREVLANYEAKDTKYSGDWLDGTITYDINEKNLLSFNVGGYSNNSNINNMFGTERTFLMSTNQLLSAVNSSRSTQTRSGNWQTGVDYQLSTDVPDELLTISYRYQHMSDCTESYTKIENLDPATTTLETATVLNTQKQHVLSEALMGEHTGQIDYTRPFGKRHTIETGVKYIGRIGSSNPVEEYWNGTDWVPGSIFGQDSKMSSSPMTYFQNILGLYGAYSLKVKKMTFKAGLRSEYGSYQSKFKDLPEANLKRSFLDWVPAVSVGYNFSTGEMLKLSYGLQVNRPGIAQLNPFRNQSVKNSISYGNPYLKNEREQSVSLSYSKYSAKLYLSAGLSGSWCNNAIAQYSFVDVSNPNLLHTTYGNIAKRQSLSLSLYGNYNPTAWWRLYGNLYGSYGKLQAEGVTEIQTPYQWSNKGFGGSFYLGSYIRLPKGWSTNVNGGLYMSGVELNQNSTSVSHWHNVAISKSLFKSKLNLSLVASNFIKPTRCYQTVMRSVGFESVHNNYYNSMYLGVSVSYSFGEMKSQIRRVQRTIQNTDLKGSGNNQSGEGGRERGGN